MQYPAWTGIHSILIHRAVLKKNHALLYVPVQAPDESGRNGIISNYTIRYSAKDSGDDFIEVVTMTNATQYTLTGLQSDTLYEIFIAANTVNGTGPFSPPEVCE